MNARTRPSGRWRGMSILGMSIGVAVVAATIVVDTANADPVSEEVSMRQTVSARLMAPRIGYPYSAMAPLETVVETMRWSPDRRWAFGGGVIRVPDGVEAAPVTALFIAHRVGQSWQVSLEGTPEFAAAAQIAPVVDAEEKPLFAATARPAIAGTATGLALPWKQGAGWGHSGVHGDSGQSRPYNAIDFHGGDGRVLASRAGKMYRFCRGGRWPFIKVVHDNGYSTGYYHLSNTTTKSDGASVAAGEYLGMTDVQLPCGGSASGDHVHWTLWQGNRPIPVDGKEIGGWTWHEESGAYEGWAERNGKRVHSGRCCVVNYGASGNDPGPGPGKPAGTVNSGEFDRVNIRKGPGRDHEVIGSATHGQVVEISCTARGGTVTGPLGTSDLWNRITSDGYISAAFVDTGGKDPVAPAC